MENRVYVSGWTALMGFCQRLFVVITVGSLFAYVFLRSEMARSGSPILHADRATSADALILNEIARAETTAAGTGHRWGRPSLTGGH